MPNLNANSNLYPQVATLGYDPKFDKINVGTARDKFRDEFFTYDTTNSWQTVATGAGQTISLGGVTNGARYLNIASGTTINSETILLSKQSFQFPVKLSVGLSMSQRIANQEVYIELVSVDADGNVETDSTQPSASLLNATNCVSHRMEGTNATQASYICRGYGISPNFSALSTIGTTVATGTSPDFIPATIFEIVADMEEVVWQTRSVDTLSAAVSAYKRTQNLPDPSKNYKIRIRVRNLGTAPASSTDVRIHFVRVLDSTRFTVDFARHMGRASDQSDSLPVMVSNSPSVASINGSNGVPTAPTNHFINSAASTNGQNLATASCGVQSLYVTNTGATVAFVKLYNKATAPTVGTDIPEMIIAVPAAVSGVPGVAQITPGFSGLRFTSGLGLAITGAVADTDTTAVAAGQVKVKLSRTS